MTAAPTTTARYRRRLRSEGDHHLQQYRVAAGGAEPDWIRELRAGDGIHDDGGARRGPRALWIFLLGVLVSAVLSCAFLGWPRSRQEDSAPPPQFLPEPALLAVLDDDAEVAAVNNRVDGGDRGGDDGLEFGRTQLQQKRPSQVRDYRECEAEALQALHAAAGVGKRQHRQHDGHHGADGRARRLLDHALSVCPNHPRVLVAYGEFLEHHGDGHDDLVRADHYYVRAAAFSEAEDEERAKALDYRRRTAPRVEEIDRQTLRRIDDKRRAFLRASEGPSGSSSTGEGSGSSAAAVRRAKKEAYFQHIYHTVGIEGNSFTLAQTRSLLETRLAVGGKSVAEHNQVLGMDAALRFVNQTLVDKPGDITVEDILEIHRRVVGFVDPTEAGLFRRTQVFVGDHVPPSPEHILPLMQRFLEWLNDPDAAERHHPVTFAALAHYKLVHIHPFADGNGRTSRLLMNLILMRAGFPPVIVRRQDRLPYYQHLVTANEGDARPFARFVAECAERTLDAYIAATDEGGSSHRRAMAPFGGNHFAADSESKIVTDAGRLEYHEAVVMGGALNENVTIDLN